MLIYDQEKRWTGLSKAEHAARSANTRAFGKEFAGTIKVVVKNQGEDSNTACRERRLADHGNSTQLWINLRMSPGS